jgi:hypothetical protein
LAQIHTINDLIALFLQNDHFYRPMSRVIMLGIPYALFGTASEGYHLFILGLHLINVILVYHLMRSLSASRSSSLVAMCIYGFYPVHFTPIVWISGIQESSVSFFVLVASLAFIGWRRTPARVWRYGLAMVAYLAALLSKESAFLLPAWLMFTDLLVLRPRHVRSGIKYLAPYAGLMTVAIAFLILRSVKADVQGQGGSYTISLTAQSLWNNFQLYVRDIYSLPGTEPANLLALTSMTLGIFGVLILVLQNNRSWLLLGGTWLLCFLAPVLGLAGRHYSYYFSLPAIGIALIVCGIAESFSQVPRKRLKPGQQWIKSSCLVALVLLWAGYCYARVGDPGLDVQNLLFKGNQAAEIARDFRKQIPAVVPGSILYVEGASNDEASLEGLFKFYAPALKQIVFNAAEADTPDTGARAYYFTVKPSAAQ